MSEATSPDPLERALRALPRERASAGFTAAVVERLERPARRRAPAAALRWGIAVALLFALLLGVEGARQRSRQRDRLSERVGELRREHRQLQEELVALRRAADSEAPVLYLGGNDSVDLVLDLSPLMETAGGEPDDRLHPLPAVSRRP